MRRVCIVSLLLLLALAPPRATAQSTASPAADPSIEGLWKAERWFGPRARGPLVIRQVGSWLVAEIAGRRAEVRRDGAEWLFDLPNGEGGFRGRPGPDGSIIGLWRQPPTVSDGVMITPVRLRANGAQQWIGEVAPAEDTFTLWLLVQRRNDGSLGVILRNPERDYGAQIGADHLVLRDGDVDLVGGRGARSDTVLANGRYDAGRDALTLRFPGRGESYDFVRDDDHSDFYPRGRTPARYAYAPPPQLDDGWPTATLASEQIDHSAIEALVQSILVEDMTARSAHQVHALLVARHGRLVLEEYFHGNARERLHTTRSAGKSVTSILVGATIAADRRLQLSSPVYATMNGGVAPAGLDSRAQAMTLDHLLSQTSGFHCDDSDPAAPGAEETMSDQDAEPDFYRYTLAVPMAYAPGRVAVYCSANPNLALGMVARATGEDPIYDFERRVAQPMRIDHYGWVTDGAGQAYGGGSVQLRARDFLKIGQLMLNGGTWQRRRILTADYVERATSPLNPLARIGYGYLWWVDDIPYKDGVTRAYMALGAGGQIVMVVPRLDLVIAIMAGQFSGPGWRDIQLNLAPRLILPAIRERGDNPRTPVVPLDYASPYGRVPPPPPELISQ